MPTPSASKGLATRWQSSEDGLSYTPDPAQGSDLPPYPWFSPTRHFNADDVLFTWQRLLDEHHPSTPSPAANTPIFYSLGLGNLIKRVYKKGPYEVVFEAEPPRCLLPRHPGQRLRHRALRRVRGADAKGRHPGAAGQPPHRHRPFSFKEYRHNEFVRYLRHPGYWGGEARMEQLIYDITPKSSKRLARSC